MRLLYGDHASLSMRIDQMQPDFNCSCFFVVKICGFADSSPMGFKRANPDLCGLFLQICECGGDCLDSA